MAVDQKTPIASATGHHVRSMILAFFILAMVAIYLVANNDRSKLAGPEVEQSQTAVSEYGKTLFVSGEYFRAAEMHKIQYRLNPNPMSQLELLKSLYSIGDFKGMMALSKEQVEPSLTFSLLTAEALVRVHQYDAAREVALEILKVNGNSAHADYLLARIFYAESDVKSALKWLQKTLRSHSSVVSEAWMFRARMALDANEIKVARSAIERAVEAGVAEERIQLLDVEIFIRENKLDEAQSFIENRELKRLALNPTTKPLLDVVGIYMKSLMAHANHDHVTAARLMNTIEPWLMHEIRGPLQIATINWLAGDIAQARAQFAQYVSLAPHDWVALDLYVNFLIEEGSEDASNTQLNALIRENNSLGAFRQLQSALDKKDADAAYKIAKASYQPRALRSGAEVLFGAPLSGTNGLRDLSFAQSLFFNQLSDFDVVKDQTQSEQGVFNASVETAISVSQILKGESLLRKMAPKGAMKLFDAALERTPSFQRALALRTIADVLDGNQTDAQTRLEAIKVNSDVWTHAQVLLSRVFLVDQRLDDAIAVLRPMETVLLKNAGDAIYYADILKLAGKSADLVSFADLAVKEDADLLLTARLVEWSGQAAQSAKFYREALLAVPSDPYRLQEYGRIMRSLGRMSDAVALLEKVKTASGDDAFVSREIELLRAGNLLTNWNVPEIEKVSQNDSLVSPEAMSSFVEDFLSREFGREAFQYGIGLTKTGQNAEPWYRMACFWGHESGCREMFESRS